MLLLFLLSIVIGVIVGLTGMGGILAIPAIILLAKASPHAAMATALASFLLTGVIGTLNFRAMGVLERKNWMPLCLGGLPFTFAGAWLNACFPASLLLFLLGCIIILAGVSALHAWRAFSGINVNASPRRSLIIAAVGAGAGLAAGLTGAGGPVLSIPLLIALGMPAFPAVVTGMPFQIATSVAGSAGNLLRGHIDFSLLLPVAIPIALGLVAGNRLAPHIPAHILKKAIGLLCLVIGAAQCIRAVWG
ncbi:MAG TPA: sulfite exporter TauE/SafE family protein [Candidatus Mailhella excrementigallinarum]|nr:MAG: sulfite exporter TauE/SafE family protein [Desulfovibrionaceae bacterium]HIV66658.1 sulfite exporter TauE/SafE family protein [Candidatus Mailhella excrementigallinarum]